MSKKSFLISNLLYLTLKFIWYSVYQTSQIKNVLARPHPQNMSIHQQQTPHVVTYIIKYTVITIQEYNINGLCSLLFDISSTFLTYN